MEHPEHDPQLELRHLIVEAKRAARPDARTEARMLSALLTRLPPGSSTGGGGSPTADAPISPIGGLASITTMKLVIGGAIAVGSIAIATAIVRDPPPRREAIVEPRAPESVTEPAPMSAASLPTTDAAPTPLSTTPATPPSTVPAKVDARTPSREPPRSAPPSAATSDAITAELALVSAAEAALTRGDDREALDLATTHRERHPDGQLALERDAIAAAAACGLGDPDASRRAAAFLAAHPRAAAAAKVRTRCEAAAKKPAPQ